jgi:hypothetical protein
MVRSHGLQNRHPASIIAPFVSKNTELFLRHRCNLDGLVVFIAKKYILYVTIIKEQPNGIRKQIQIPI